MIAVLIGVLQRNRTNKDIFLSFSDVWVLLCIIQSQVFQLDMNPELDHKYSSPLIP